MNRLRVLGPAAYPLVVTFHAKNVADIKRMVTAFTTLFGAPPELTAGGYIFDVKNEPMNLARDYPVVKIGQKTVTVKIGYAGLVTFNVEDMEQEAQYYLSHK